MQSILDNVDVDARVGLCMCVQRQDQPSKSTLERVAQSSSPTHLCLAGRLSHHTRVVLLPVQEELKSSQNWEAAAGSHWTKDQTFNPVALKVWSSQAHTSMYLVENINNPMNSEVQCVNKSQLEGYIKESLVSLQYKKVECLTNKASTTDHWNTATLSVIYQMKTLFTSVN